MELYFEQNVTNKNVDERTKRTKALAIAKSVCMILGVLTITASGMLGDLFFHFFWIFLLLAIPFFVAMYILGRINKRNNTEYDYVIDDECIMISEIYFRERRKLKHTIRLRLIESIGVFDSEGYKKASIGVNKKILALVNYDDEDSIAYVCYKTSKGARNMCFIEPNVGFIMALRRALSSNSLLVFDKSIHDLEKRLAQKEREQSEFTSEIDNNDDDDDTTQIAADDDCDGDSDQ